jgi:hypothetical protein
MLQNSWGGEWGDGGYMQVQCIWCIGCIVY